ncbi:MAG: cytochrome-c oxidase, cbb3-type subunit III [Gammaproteobacteria bacterium]|nr:cytochrome-c oxidase, cbb3-type subunit III [Gammaproteobacteria bacterium]MDH3409181.1 cytochrome-c oxidase, cbb3-type subunit III [Gammaproteobacteria bacterium]
MAAFWAWFVAVGTIAFVIWCVWLISWASKQGPQNKQDEDLVGHKWDGDLEEWNNPAPKWWLYLYFITIAWAVGYMIVYPGIGAFDGVAGWSQQGQYEAEMQAAEARYEPIYARFAEMDFETLAKDPDANKLGKSLFAGYCTTCHGSDARGAAGYPNLTDNDWLWGKTEAAITTTIQQGRNSIMPNLSAALGGDAGIDNMVSYVQSLSGAVAADEAAMSAQPMFVALCSACHMADGSGNQLLGGPNLTDDVWLYGSSTDAIRTTIVQGRNGVMPAHGQLLGDKRTKILAAYVYSMSNAE